MGSPGGIKNIDKTFVTAGCSLSNVHAFTGSWD